MVTSHCGPRRRRVLLPSCWLVLVGAGAFACTAEHSAPDAGPLFAEPVLTRMSHEALHLAKHVDTIAVGDTSPLLRIGAEEGNGDYLFQDIIDVVVDSAEAHLFVADGGRRQVLVYRISDGRFERGIGGPGGGPGEFAAISDVFLLADSALGVWDPARERLTIFTLSGMVAATISRSATTTGAPVTSQLAQRSRHLMWTGRSFIVEERADPLQVQSEDQRGVLRILDSALAPEDTLLEFRVAGISATQRTNGGGTVTTYDAPSLLGPAPVWDVAENGTVALAPGGPYEIALTAPHARRLSRVLVRDEEPVPVSIDDRMGLLAAEAAKPANGIPPDYSLATLERQVRDRFSRYRPAITDVMWDGTDRLWARRFDTSFDPNGGGGTWDVVNVTTDRIEAVVAFAHGIVPATAHGDVLYCVQRDSLGVERILVLRNPVRDGRP